MITAPNLLTELQSKHFVFSLTEQGKLSYVAPENELTPDVRELIRAHKQELIHLLGTVVTEQLPRETRQVTMIDHKPLICHKCLNTNPDDFKLNLLRSRWICCNCGEPSHRVFFLPEPATPGDGVKQLRQEITEMIRAGHSYKESDQAVSVPATLAQGSPIPRQEPTIERHTEPLPVVKQEQKKATSLNTSHGVLTDSSLVFCTFTEQGRKVQKLAIETTPESIADVCNLANTHSLTHVWIMPGTKLSEKVTRDFVEVPGDTWDTFTSYTGDDKTPQEKRFPMFSRIWRKNTSGQYGRTVKIGYPWRGSWNWRIDSPVTMLATIDYLERTLQVPCEWSPGHMFMELVRLLNKTANRQSWLRESTIELKSLPFNKAARDLVWKVDELVITPDGEEWYLIEFDKNSQYLAACRGVNVGAGDPEHITECSHIDTTLPGIYRVTVNPGASIFNGETLPLVHINSYEKPLEWMTGDILTYAISQGYEITIHECYQWQEKHRALESTALAIWNARHSLATDTASYPHKQGRENAYNTVKVVALVGVGKFAYKKATRFLRPDYWSDIVGKARETMLRKLHTLQGQGYTPVFIYADNLYFLSHDKNPETAIPGLMEREDKLGGFKCKSTLLVTPEIINAFSTLSPGELKEFLNNLAGNTEKEDEE